MKLRDLSDGDITSILERHFGLSARPHGFMAGELAVNIAVDVAPAQAGFAEVPTRLVLKAEFPSAAMTAEHGDWICSVQESAREAGLPVALQVQTTTPFRSAGGQSCGFLAYAPVGDGGDERVLLRLQEFLPGDIAATTQVPADYPEQVGRVVAQTVQALHGCPAEPEPIFHPWAFETTGANVGFAIERIRTLEASGRLGDGDFAQDPLVGTQLTQDLTLAACVGRAFEESVRPLAAQTPHQVAHQDINDFNILISNGQISGLLDFGDSRTAPRMAELAIAAAYTMLGADDPLGAVNRTVEAYASAARGTAAELTSAERDAVPLAAAARLCLNASTWTARTMGMNPDDSDAAYGRARMARTWPVVRAVVPHILPN